MNIIALCGICIVSCIFIVVLKKISTEDSPMLIVISAVVMLVYILKDFTSVFNEINSITANSGINNENIKLMFKALGICYLTQMTKDICIDCSALSLAQKIDLAGKITIAVLSVPLVTQVLQIITKLTE